MAVWRRGFEKSEVWRERFEERSLKNEVWRKKSDPNDWLLACLQIVNNNNKFWSNQFVERRFVDTHNCGRYCCIADEFNDFHCEDRWPTSPWQRDTAVVDRLRWNLEVQLQPDSLQVSVVFRYCYFWLAHRLSNSIPNGYYSIKMRNFGLQTLDHAVRAAAWAAAWTPAWTPAELHKRIERRCFLCGLKTSLCVFFCQLNSSFL